MEEEVTVLKVASTQSLSNQSTITYEIGTTPDGTVHVRLAGNSGNGIFNGYWVPLPEILMRRPLSTS